MTEYNPIAWDKLAELTNLSLTQLLEEIKTLGISPHMNTFTHWRQTGGIAPENLVAICNHFHFPISFFTRIIGNYTPRNYRIIPSEEWCKIGLLTNRLIDYTANVLDLKREGAIDKIGCSNEYYDAMRKFPLVALPKKLSFATLLKYINSARMYPGDVFIDRNEPFLFEQKVTPFYNNEAMAMHDRNYPKPENSIVAEDFIDITEFLRRYVLSERLEGDEKVIAMQVKTLNEISSIITNLRTENQELRNRVRDLESGQE